VFAGVNIDVAGSILTASASATKHDANELAQRDTTVLMAADRLTKSTADAGRVSAVCASRAGVEVQKIRLSIRPQVKAAVQRAGPINSCEDAVRDCSCAVGLLYARALVGHDNVFRPVLQQGGNCFLDEVDGAIWRRKVLRELRCSQGS
jgi:hypothetical protein